MDKAQAKFIASGLLQQLGGKYAKVNVNDLPFIEQGLIKAGLIFNKIAQRELKKNKAISSGALLDLSLPQVVKKGKQVVLQVGYPIDSKQAKYSDYVNKGVRGTKNEKSDSSSPYFFKKNKKSIPVSVVKKWIESGNKKSVSVKKYTKLGTEQRNISEDLASIIARSIHRKGLRSTHYIDKAFKEAFNDKFKNMISKELKKDIQLQITSYYGDNNS